MLAVRGSPFSSRPPSSFWNREILPGYIIAATIARFEIKCDLVCVYMHPDALEEVGNSLLSYLEARTATREIFICGEFNRIDQKFSAIWELILATGLLRQVTGGFPTYRSGEKASELDAIQFYTMRMLRAAGASKRGFFGPRPSQWAMA